MSNQKLIFSSHMCVYFHKENSFQVIGDPKGSFKGKNFVKCLDESTGKWRTGEIKFRGF